MPASIDDASAAQAYLKTLFPLANDSFFTQLDALYPASDFAVGSPFFQQNFFSSSSYAGYKNTWPESNTAFWKLQAQYGDYFIDCGTYDMGRAAVSEDVPVWKYIFNSGSYLHAATAGDLFYPSSTSQADDLKAYYLAFAQSLDPNANTGVSAGANRIYFPPYSALYAQQSKYVAMQVNDTAFGIIFDPDQNARCDFFRENTLVVRNKN